MDYTEKEKKGIDRVERMNRLFDRILMPAIGILIIMLLLSFIVRKYKDKFGSEGDYTAAETASARNVEPRAFVLRRELLGNYPEYVRQFEAYGYSKVEGYSYDLSLCKTVDSEMSIFQFSDSALGELTIINYIPENKNAAYDSLSIAVSSCKLINVTVKNGEEKHTVTFLSTDFTLYSAADEEQFNALMKLVDIDEITAMYDIFETDIFNLSKSCQTGD
ncbi:MAG: hypothetical protein IJM51_04125 [Clostridia bacterium]|nr:hypothetical protein [Clostridia bacterium]